MAKISQEIARKVSRKVVIPIDKKLQVVNEEIRAFLTDCYKATVPVDVMKFWKKNSEWLISVSSVHPKGMGISGEYRYESIDSSPSMSNSTRNLELSPEQAQSFLNMCDKRDDLKAKSETTQKEIEAMILTLGTHKKVSEQLPEVMQFFPEGSIKENTQLMVQLAPVRKKVQCLVSADVEKKCIETI